MQNRRWVFLVAPVVGVLLLALVAYSHSTALSIQFDEHMRRDIDAFMQATGPEPAMGPQARALKMLMDSTSHNTLSYVSSSTDAAIGIAAAIGVIILATVMPLANRLLSERR